MVTSAIRTGLSFTPMAERPAGTVIVPWFVCRDDEGRWCVERHGAWSCQITLTGAMALPDDRCEEHARQVAAALNRAYMASAAAG